MVLVDSSIWIAYFNKGEHDSLTQLLRDDLIVTDEIILSELIPSAQLKKERELVVGLRALPIIRLDIDRSAIRKLQPLNLSNGINRVGIPDLIIVQQAIQQDLTLWTTDKHFI